MEVLHKNLSSAMECETFGRHVSILSHIKSLYSICRETGW